MPCLEKLMAMLALFARKPCVRSLKSSLCIWSQAVRLCFSEFSTSSLFPPPIFLFLQLFFFFKFSSHLPSFRFLSNCLMCKHVMIAEFKSVCVPQQTDFFLCVFDFCTVLMCTFQANFTQMHRAVFCILVLLHPKRGTQFASSYLQAQSVMHREFNIWFFSPVIFQFIPELLLEGTESLTWEQTPWEVWISLTLSYGIYWHSFPQNNQLPHQGGST